MNFDASNALRPRLHRLIPGGAHTYAKGDDQYPLNAPAFSWKNARLNKSARSTTRHDCAMPVHRPRPISITFTKQHRRPKTSAT